jgi:hypothetical protein
MENALHLRHLRPKNYNVQLQDKSFATVPVFDTRAMIMDLLSNPTVMQKSNFAVGYDVLTGAVDKNHPANKNTMRCTQAMLGSQPGIAIAPQTTVMTTLSICPLD